jgi:hypothetical protein
VNTPESYERRTDPSHAQPEPPAGASEVAALAVHKDPSLHAEETASAEASEQPRASIAWVRPTELPTSAGSGRLRHAADAQADVVRRYRRAPLTAASRFRGRVSRSSIVGSDPAARTSTSPTEGVEL